MTINTKKAVVLIIAGVFFQFYWGNNLELYIRHIWLMDNRQLFNCNYLSNTYYTWCLAASKEIQH